MRKGAGSFSLAALGVVAQAFPTDLPHDRTVTSREGYGRTSQNPYYKIRTDTS